MTDKLIEQLKKHIDKNHKDLITKYNVLVKRTNSIITSLSKIDEKLNYLVETMSMFELVEEDEEEEFDPYHVDPEDYEDPETD